VSWPRHIRWFAKYLAMLLVVVALAGAGGALWLRHRVERAQQQFDAVAIGEPWQELPGYSMREATPARSGVLYWRIVRTPYRPTVWEVLVGPDGRVSGKHRYD